MNESKKIKCAFCAGTGKDPFSIGAQKHHGYKAKCQVCNGRGWVRIEEPYKTCPYCRGSGIDPRAGKLPCIVCRGKGANHIKSDKPCSRCKGTGKSRDGLPCTTCGGKGYQ